VGTANSKLGKTLPQASVVGLACCLPRIFEHFVGMKRTPGVEQSLRLVQRLIGSPHLALALSRNSRCGIGQRATESVTWTRVTRAPGIVAVTIHDTQSGPSPRAALVASGLLGHASSPRFRRAAVRAPPRSALHAEQRGCIRARKRRTVAHDGLLVRLEIAN
jgi:hypothetical protein